MAAGKKTGGRKKGTSNRLSGTVKGMIAQIVETELQQLPNLLNKLEPKEKAELIIKLLPYIVPKMLPVNGPKEPTEYDKIKLFRQQLHQSFPQKS